MMRALFLLLGISLPFQAIAEQPPAAEQNPYFVGNRVTKLAASETHLYALVYQLEQNWYNPFLVKYDADGQEVTRTDYLDAMSHGATDMQVIDDGLVLLGDHGPYEAEGGYYCQIAKYDFDMNEVWSACDPEKRLTFNDFMYDDTHILAVGFETFEDFPSETQKMPYTPYLALYDKESGERIYEKQFPEQGQIDEILMAGQKWTLLYSFGKDKDGTAQLRPMAQEVGRRDLQTDTETINKDENFSTLPLTTFQDITYKQKDAMPSLMENHEHRFVDYESMPDADSHYNPHFVMVGNVITDNGNKAFYFNERAAPNLLLVDVEKGLQAAYQSTVNALAFNGTTDGAYFMVGRKQVKAQNSSRVWVAKYGETSRQIFNYSFTLPCENCEGGVRKEEQALDAFIWQDRLWLAGEMLSADHDQGQGFIMNMSLDGKLPSAIDNVIRFQNLWQKEK